MPSLLHTDAYARTLTTTSTSTSNREPGRPVNDGPARRTRLTRPKAPLTMTLVLDEALLHRPVGGPAVMAEQLRYLADLAVRPNVSLRVVPYAAGHHPGLVTGAFTLLDFRPAKRDGDTDMGIVYAENLTGELYLDQPHELQHYRDTHAAILSCALDEAATPGPIGHGGQRPGGVNGPAGWR